MGKIRKIIQVSDIHIRNFQRLEEYGEQLSKFVEMCKKEAEGFEKDELRIAICGDIAHNKNDVSNELIMFVSSFIRELEQIAKVIVISGNHDLMVNNQSRTDTLTAIFETAKFSNSVFLDSMLGYESGCVVDENIIWAVYSIFDDFKRPNIEEAVADNNCERVIGLYHGVIVGASLDNGTVMDNGVDLDIFSGCDCVMAGDIHKRQELKRGDVDVVYSGSLIQQTFGERISQHGYVVWDVETMSHKFVDLDSEYGLYDVEINSIEDIDEDRERLKNF